jgi:predicted enzyme related to lactoylglutathione lyase
MQRTYPHGVTCWIDLETPDPEASQRFYGELFGWTFTEAMPPGAPGSYLIASKGGADAGAVAPAPAGSGTAARWNTYVAVDDAEATAAAVTAGGGTVVAPPEDAGPAGRSAVCRDPQGAEFRLWQAGARPGAQVTNAPGTWNFSDLHTSDVAAALAFYGPLFTWQADDMQGPQMLRVPGYGDHLEATVDPDIRKRQESAPEGFEDVIGGIAPTEPGEATHWHVTFAVEDRDETAAAAERLGATVVSSAVTPWTRIVLLRDPQGAEFTASQFAPPG